MKNKIHICERCGHDIRFPEEYSSGVVLHFSCKNCPKEAYQEGYEEGRNEGCDSSYEDGFEDGRLESSKKEDRKEGLNLVKKEFTGNILVTISKDEVRLWVCNKDGENIFRFKAVGRVYKSDKDIIIMPNV